MDCAIPISDEQAALWNGAAGRAWVEGQALLDQMLKPIESLLVNAVSARGIGPVLDVGCGTGSTTLALARFLGAQTATTGIDISEPMLTAARTRAEGEGSPASFIRADAATYPFEPSSFATIISRFGVMFFDDPVRAFANLRRAARDDAELRFVAWRSADENPFMTTAERAAAPLLPDLPPRRLDGPGQFAFSDKARVATILGESGWSDIDICAIDVDCTLPEPELDRYITRLGRVGVVLEQADEETRAQVLETVRPAFRPYVHGTEVRFAAACWIVRARASGACHE